MRDATVQGWNSTETKPRNSSDQFDTDLANAPPSCGPRLVASADMASRTGHTAPIVGCAGPSAQFRTRFALPRVRIRAAAEVLDSGAQCIMLAAKPAHSNQGLDMPIRLDFANYRSFISEFRAANGVGVATNLQQIEVAYQDNGPAFRYQTYDLYMTHVRRPGADWKELKELNYANMNIPDAAPLTRQSIEHACLTADVFDGRSCAMVMLVTSEAARSQVVYQVVQQVLQNKPATRDMIAPLFNIWDLYTTKHHKCRPVKYGALGVRDYYDDPKAKESLRKLQGAGFLIE